MKLLLTFFLVLSANAATLVSCHDGDTCRFNKDGKVIKVRFAGVDAPEADQPFGTEARDFLVKLLTGKDVKVDCLGTSYDRLTCKIHIGDMDVQRELVKNGFARDYSKFSGKKYKADEEHARSMKLGIWSATDITSPHCWRHGKTKQCRKNKLFQP